MAGTVAFYYFENTKNNFFSCIIGSSNISFSAFRLSHELNVEIRDKKISEEYKEKMTNILSSPYLLDITEQVIQTYEEVYEENKNMMLKSEYVEPDDINEMQFEEANVVQKEALIALKKSRDELRSQVREINTLKCEMHEIKSMLQTIMDKQ
jgi:phosphatidylserine/phosphatidylglycerophosphate/cardiolipin synthase-like enzyme